MKIERVADGRSDTVVSALNTRQSLRSESQEDVLDGFRQLPTGACHHFFWEQAREFFP
jgi:hypothetical protein